MGSPCAFDERQAGKHRVPCWQWVVTGEGEGRYRVVRASAMGVLRAR